MKDGNSGRVEVDGHVGGEDLGKEVVTFLVGCYRVKVHHLLDCDRVGCILCCERPGELLSSGGDAKQNQAQEGQAA